MIALEYRNFLLKTTLRLSVVSFCLMLVSCSGAGSGGASSPNPGVDDQVLLARAEALAQTEIARLAAEALVYRSQTELHETVLPVIGSKVGVYLKMYREFTGYEIVDIVRSNSVLYPIEIAIRYDFDILSTEVQGMSEPNAESDAQADYRFRVFRKDSVIRRYRCDAEGNPVDTFPELPRLKFYGANTPTSIPGPPEQGRIPF